MNSPEQHPVTDEEARRLAKGTVRLIRSPLKIFGAKGLEKPLTIADTIRLGGTLLAALNVATGRDWLKERNREFLTKVAELIYQPEAMEEFFYIRFKKRTENPGDIAEAITQVEEEMAGPGAVRKFLKKAIKDVLPKPRRGRPTEFKPASDPDRFLALSAQLNPVCGQFLGLREQFRRKSNKELIEFLRPEDPIGVDLLRKREGYISETMNGLDFRILKTQQTKGRWLADAVAGKELFDWSFTYSVQRAGEFRRSKGIDPKE
jgi:hypothetical protein